MKQFYLIPLVFLQVFFNLACMDSNTKTYDVKKISRAIQLTGYGTDTAWEQTRDVIDFSYPWRNEAPPATSFKARWDDQNLYFLYRATDPKIIAKTANGGEKDVVNSDRVEIFFKADDKMDPYYSLEMDALGRVLDTEGRYYRKVDFNWQWPAGHLTLKASTDEKGYWVEGAISLSSLRDLGMLQGTKLKAGLYRGEYLTNTNEETEVRWISWVKPDSETPDFHIPSSFGVLQLVE